MNQGSTLSYYQGFQAFTRRVVPLGLGIFLWDSRGLHIRSYITARLALYWGGNLLGVP